MAGLGDGIKYGKFSPSAVFSGGDAKEKKNIRGEGVKRMVGPLGKENENL